MGARHLTARELSIASTLKRDHKMTWRQVGKIMGRNGKNLCLACRPKDARSWWITQDEIARAAALRSTGLSWAKIGIQLGREGTALRKLVLGKRKPRRTTRLCTLSTVSTECPIFTGEIRRGIEYSA